MCLKSLLNRSFLSVFSAALRRRRQAVGEHLCLFCVLADGGTMKTVLVLLLLCLSDPGQSDCQADCLSCSNILPRHLSFNTKVKSTHTHTHIYTQTQTQIKLL